MKRLKMILLIVLGVLIVTSALLYGHWKVVAGKDPAPGTFDGVANYKNGVFFNLHTPQTKHAPDTAMVPGKLKPGKMLRFFFGKPAETKPAELLPAVKTDLKNIQADVPVIVWFGHSSFLIQYKDFNILVDPVLNSYASPIKGINNAFKTTHDYTPEEFPEIDLLLITHDHYDHLDHYTAKQLRDKTHRVVTGLGVSSHLKHWGYEPNRMKELYWNQTEQINDFVRVTATETHHFSGRTTQRNPTLWNGYVIELDSFRLFISGDGGYAAHFKEIGQTYGPFDLAIMENGQYNADWASIHLFPEEALQGAIDAGARMILPSHWAKFALSFHPWNAPVKELLQRADSIGFPVTVPKIGEPYRLQDPPIRDRWYE